MANLNSIRGVNIGVDPLKKKRQELLNPLTSLQRLFTPTPTIARQIVQAQNRQQINNRPSPLQTSQKNSVAARSNASLNNLQAPKLNTNPVKAPQNIVPKTPNFATIKNPLPSTPVTNEAVKTPTLNLKTNPIPNANVTPQKPAVLNKLNTGVKPVMQMASTNKPIPAVPKTETLNNTPAPNNAPIKQDNPLDGWEVKQKNVKYSEDGWKKYYDEEFKKEDSQLSLLDRLSDSNQAARRAEATAKRKYANELIQKAYDDNGNTLDREAAEMAKVMSGKSYEDARKESEISRQKSIAIGATTDYDSKKYEEGLKKYGEDYRGNLDQYNSMSGDEQADLLERYRNSYAELAKEFKQGNQSDDIKERLHNLNSVISLFEEYGNTKGKSAWKQFGDWMASGGFIGDIGGNALEELLGNVTGTDDVIDLDIQKRQNMRDDLGGFGVANDILSLGATTAMNLGTGGIYGLANAGVGGANAVYNLDDKVIDTDENGDIIAREKTDGEKWADVGNAGLNLAFALAGKKGIGPDLNKIVGSNSAKDALKVIGKYAWQEPLWAGATTVGQEGLKNLSENKNFFDYDAGSFAKTFGENVAQDVGMDLFNLGRARVGNTGQDLTGNRVVDTTNKLADLGNDVTKSMGDQAQKVVDAANKHPLGGTLDDVSEKSREIAGDLPTSDSNTKLNEYSRARNENIIRDELFDAAASGSADDAGWVDDLLSGKNDAKYIGWMKSNNVSDPEIIKELRDSGIIKLKYDEEYPTDITDIDIDFQKMSNEQRERLKKFLVEYRGKDKNGDNHVDYYDENRPTNETLFENPRFADDITTKEQQEASLKLGELAKQVSSPNTTKQTQTLTQEQSPAQAQIKSPAELEAIRRGIGQVGTKTNANVENRSGADDSVNKVKEPELKTKNADFNRESEFSETSKTAIDNAYKKIEENSKKLAQIDADEEYGRGSAIDNDIRRQKYEEEIRKAQQEIQDIRAKEAEKQRAKVEEQLKEEQQTTEQNNEKPTVNEQVIEAPKETGDNVRVQETPEEIARKAAEEGTVKQEFPDGEGISVESKTETTDNKNVSEQNGKIPTTNEKVVEAPKAESTTEVSKANFDVDKYVAEQTKKQAKGTGRSPKEAFSNMRAEIKHALVDDAVAYEKYFDKLEKAQKKSAMREGVDRVRSSDMIASQYMRDNGLQGAIKGLNSKDYNEFTQYLIAKRAIEVEQSGRKTGRDIDSDKALVEAVGNKYADREKAIRDYSHGMLNYMVDNGMISKELANKLIKDNPNYVPLNRIMEEVSSYGSKQLGNLSKQSVVRKLEGSELEIDDPINSLATNTMRMVNEAERNKVSKMISEMNAFKDNKLKEGEKPRAGYDTLNYMENGKKVTYEVPKLVATEMKNINKATGDVGKVLKVLGAPTRALRAGATSNNPLFAASNLIRDQLQTLYTGKLSTTFSPTGNKKAIQAVFGIGKEGKALQAELRRNGIIGNEYRQTYGYRDLVDQIKNETSVPKKALERLKHPINAMGDLIGKTEEFTRAQQYFGTKGDATAKAQAARNNTLNFSRGGSAVRVLNRVIPFLNANIQGGRMLTNQIAQRPVRTTVALTATAGLLAAARSMASMQNQELWDRISDEEKKNNLIIMGPDAKYNSETNRVDGLIKIPLPQMTYPISDAVNNLDLSDENKAASLAELAGTIFTAFTGIEAPDFSGDSLGDVIRPVANQLTPTIAKPLIEAVTNTDMYTGRDIVSEYDKNKNPEDKGAKYTSEVAKQISKVTNIDAPIIDQFISGYGGSLASNLADGVGKEGNPVSNFMKEGAYKRFASAYADSQYKIEEENARKYKDSIKNSEEFKNLSSDEQNKLLNAVDNDTKAIAGYNTKNERGEEADKLSKRQKAIVDDGFNADDYIKSVKQGWKNTKSGTNINVNDGISNSSKSAIELRQSMTSSEWNDYIKKNSTAEYDYAKAKYENDLANGDLSDADKITREKNLKKLSVSKNYDYNTREAYSLAGKKADMQAYLDGLSDGDRDLMVKKLNALNRSMYDEGVISATTYKTRYRAINNVSASSKGGKSGSSKYGGMSSAEKSAISDIAKALAKNAGTSANKNPEKPNTQRAMATTKSSGGKTSGNVANPSTKITVRRGIV